VQLHLGFPNGGMALIDHSWTLPPGDSYFSLSLIGSTGAAYADDHHNRQLLFQGGPPRAILTREGNTCRLGMLQEFVRAIQEDRAPLVTGGDFLRSLDVDEAVSLSLAAGRSLSWTSAGYQLVE
jgi:predicted dehydrogenase